MPVNGRKFCYACRNMVFEREFTRSGIMCDWCCRKCETTPPPRCPKCGMMRLTNKDASTCCTPLGWKER